MGQQHPTTLYWTAAQQVLLAQHCEAAYPNEACGFLLGRQTAAGKVVCSVRPALNRWPVIPARTQHFLLLPDEILRVEAEAASTDWSILGFFHSHPDQPPTLSASDRAAAWPDYSYLILSVLGGRAATARCWCRQSGQAVFQEEYLQEVAETAE